MKDDSQMSSWFDVWAGAVAVAKICVANGQQGSSYVIGEHTVVLLVGRCAKVSFSRSRGLDDLAWFLTR